MAEKKPKGGLPRWYPGERSRYPYPEDSPNRWVRPPGWIVLVCLTPDMAVVRWPGGSIWSLSPREWLALSDTAPEEAKP